MRYLHRTHRVSVRWLCERFQDTASATMDYELSERMCADIYTKAFADSVTWEHACELMGVLTHKRLQAVALMHTEYCVPPFPHGGIQTPIQKLSRPWSRIVPGNGGAQSVCPGSR